MISAWPLSSTRKRCAHTTAGRHSSWSRATIITTIAITAHSIARVSPWATATLM